MRLLSRSILKRSWTRFHDDQSGMALIYVTLALPVIIGMSLLAIDYGRLSTLHSSLQHGADALALAGANELDKRSSAIDRSESAIATMITGNKSLFGNSVVTIDENVISTCYLASLPASDATPIDNSTTDGDASDCLPVANSTEREASSPDARYVHVVVDPQYYNTIFPASFLGSASSQTSTKAEAAAGYTAAVCKFTPVLMCNPFENPADPEDETKVYNDYGLFDFVESETNKRKVIALKAHDNQWAPGNFGFLEPYSGPGAKELAYSIASVSPQACFELDSISLKTEPGNIETLKKAFNVRFDLYPNGNIGGESATSYPPALNVRKGYIIKKKNGNGTPSACNDNNPVSDYTDDGLPDYTIAMGLPRDSCHYSDSCTAANGRMGDGLWGGDNPGGVEADDDPDVPDFYQYWRSAHPDHAAIPTEAEIGVDANGDGDLDDTIANNNPPSRYAVYRYEIAQGWHTDLGLNQNLDPDITERENGGPQCNAAEAIDTPDRRIIYGALINCRANGLDGGKETGIKAVAFGKFFMTEPMQGTNASNTVLYTELIDVVHPGDANGVARDIVQLYR